MFILAVRGGFTQGGEKIQCQNKIQGKTFGISTIISPVNALDLSQVSKLFENQSKLNKCQCLMNTSVRKHSKSRRFALYVVPWRRETYFKSSKCLACQNRFVTMHQQSVVSCSNSCFLVLLRQFLSSLRAENVRSEVTDVTGDVKYIGKSVFRHKNVCWGGGGAMDLPVPLLRRLCFDRIGQFTQEPISNRLLVHLMTPLLPKNQSSD